MRRELLLAAVLAAGSVATGAWRPAWAGEQYGLGRVPDAGEIAGWNIDISPDGAGLPPGHGSARDGGTLFARACAGCHGAEGRGGDGTSAPKLAGGAGTLASDHPVKTVGSYWPYATTLFDYVRRAMPLGAAQTLTPDETYALCAYVLSVNGIVPESATLDAPSLAAVQMPNRHGFVRTPDEPDAP